MSNKLTIVTSERSALPFTASDRVALGVTPSQREALEFTVGFPNIRFALATITGSSSLSAILSSTQNISSTITGSSTLSALATAIAEAQATLTGSSTLSASALAIKSASATITGSSTLTATAQGETGISTEVQAVFDRMSALTQTEMDAIEVMVDGLVADGIYADHVVEIFAPCLNGTDYKTGFLASSLIDSANPNEPVHTAGEYADFVNNNTHFLEDRSWDSFAVNNMFIGLYPVYYNADPTTNSDYFGVADGVRECYYRWRGSDTTDTNAIPQTTGGTPRNVLSGKPSGDIVGIGLRGGNTVQELQNGGSLLTNSRTFEGIVQTHPMQWHGQNLSGSPASGNVTDYRMSIGFHLQNQSDADILQMRDRCLQFLIDIGVTGVPTP